MRLTLSFICTAILLAPGVAFGATLSIFPSSVALKSGDSVDFTLQVQSSADINTIGTSVTLPPELTFLSESEGGVIQQWVEHPTYHKDLGSVSFSGIVPDGWSGKGTLAVIKVAARKDGTYSLTYDPAQTEVYKNDGNATPEPVAYGAGTLSFATPSFFFTLAALLVVILLLLKLFKRKYKVRFV